MEKRLKIIASLVAVVVLILIVVIFANQTTGRATFTPGANYGPVNERFNLYPQCTYIDENDGWGVTKQTTVRYLNEITQQYEQYSDQCVGTGNTVSELHCEGGYRKARLVNCPSGTSCDNGACIK